MTASLDASILAARPSKFPVDPSRPYAFLVETERSPAGRLEPVATLFLTNRECPFRCAMCDLWRNTTDDSVPLGAIPGQIDYALERLPPADTIKLYNSGNFFDPRAIPPEDHATIADRIRLFDRVIVENHPRLCRDVVLEFRDRLESRFEIAMGLETVHPEVLAALNKQMTVGDYQRAASWLRSHEIDVRTFVLLKPPGMTESEGVDWAVRSVRAAIDSGSHCVAVIPTRAGNGYVEQLEARNLFSPPTILSLERVLEACLPCPTARIFADLWDLERLSGCELCYERRLARLQAMNATQQVPQPVECECGDAV